MLHRITVERLNRYSNSRQIWCMGCGKRLYEMLDIYEGEPFVDKITALLDNNKKLWGETKQISKKSIAICGTDKLQDIREKNVIILITSDHYEDIYESIYNVIEEKEVLCYIYPKYYSDITPFVMKCVSIFPLRRQLLFYAGNEPHENADEIVTFLEREYKGRKYKVIYLEDSNNNDSPKVYHLNKWTVRKKNSLKEIVKYACRYGCSKFLFYENEPIEKARKEQVLIFLNHGTIPLKNVSDVLKQPGEVDYAACPGLGCLELYENQYGIDRRKQIYMMPPRVKHMIDCQGKMHELTGVSTSQVIFWLPTFRQLVGSNRKDSKDINPVAILTSNAEELNAELKDNNQVLVIKKHPREKQIIKVPKYCENIKILEEEELLSNNITLQELLKDADALLTDYSGIAFEYLLLDRPIGYVISDMDDYFRGFAVDNPTDYMPGMKISSVKEMKIFFENVKNHKDVYSDERKKLINTLFGSNAYENGAQKLIEFIDGIK